MAVLQGIGQLGHIFARSGLVESSAGLLLKVFVHFPSWRKLQDQIDLVIVPEVAEHSQNVWVSQVCLDLDFSAELMFHSCGLQLGFEQNLEGHNVFRLFLPGQVDIAKLSFAQWTTNVEI